MRLRRRFMACAALILCSAALAVCGTVGGARKDTAVSFRASGRDPGPIEPVALPGGTVDVNTGDLYELTELPQVGEVTGQAIIDHREAHGPFWYPEDLLSVKNIGVKRLEGFRDLLDLSVQE